MRGERQSCLTTQDNVDGDTTTTVTPYILDMGKLVSAQLLSYKGKYTITVFLSRLDSTPLYITKHYNDVILGGWPCWVESGCFPFIAFTTMQFELDLMAASLFFTPSPDARLELKQCTPIWINKKPRSKSCIHCCLRCCFHPCWMAQKS